MLYLTTSAENGQPLRVAYGHVAYGHEGGHTVIMRGCSRQHGPVRLLPIVSLPPCPGNTSPT
jgi:hypothetical protein